jgi:hypothetical protein
LISTPDILSTAAMSDSETPEILLLRSLLPCLIETNPETFTVSLIPPPVLPLLQGQNLTDKGCIPLTNTLAQTSYPHDFGAVPFGLFEGCNASDPNPYVFKVDPSKGWVSLNLISTASIQEMVGEYWEALKSRQIFNSCCSVD